MEKIMALVAAVGAGFSSCNQRLEIATGTEQGHYQHEKILEDRDVIWGMDFLDKDQLLFTERKGALNLFSLSKKNVTPIVGIPQVIEGGQGGLLDVRVLPSQNELPWIYLSYSAQLENGTYTTRILRGHIKQHRFQDEQILFTALPGQTTMHHYGSRIVFDDEGHFFFGVGDRGQRDLAQDLSVHMGKIFRLNLDGSVPKDNPFVRTPKAQPEIWSYGHRNPQGLFFDRVTHILWEQEHGPRGGDEINIIQRGKNYGWPQITYGREYHGPKINGGAYEGPGMEQPEYYYVPSIAPCGLLVYEGSMFPQWKGSIFSGALAHQHLNRLHKDAQGMYKEDRMFSDLSKRVRNVIEGPDGEIYFSTDDGILYRITAKGSTQKNQS
ncbi:MAG: PQQ-dependent sugar dehydrogenase [Bdellovibrionota bacterium]